MARVTVEDCLQNVKNRFELVIIASKRARQLMRGSSEPKVAWENDKPTVVALREIAMGYTDFSDVHHPEVGVVTVDAIENIEEAHLDIEETDIEIGNTAAAANVVIKETTLEEGESRPLSSNDDKSEISTTDDAAENE